MKRKTLTGSRTTGNTLDTAGNIVVGTVTPLEIKTTVQPADRVQMEALPQLRDYKQAFILYPSIELFTADAEAKTEADKVSIYGKDFEVVTVEPWLNSIREHYKVIVGR